MTAIVMMMMKMMMMMVKMTEIHTHESRCIQCHLATQVGHHLVRGAHCYRVT